MVESPDDFEALSWTGKALLQLKRFKEAAPVLEKALVIAKGRHWDTNLLGDVAAVHYAIGESAKAEALIRRYDTSSSVEASIAVAKAAGARMVGK